MEWDVVVGENSNGELSRSENDGDQIVIVLGVCFSTKRRKSE